MALSLLVAVLTLNICTITTTDAALSTYTVNAAYKQSIKGEKTCGNPPEEYYAVPQNGLKPVNRVVRLCNASDPAKAHNAPNLVDNDMNTFWQSTRDLDSANITINLTGPIHKFYYAKQIEIWFQDYYRPVQMGIYKSSDNGATYKPWHFYVQPTIKYGTPEKQCKDTFGLEYTQSSKPSTVDKVLCVTYPNETMKPIDDIVTWSPAFFRGQDVSPSSELVDWLNITNIRIEFMLLNRPFDPIAFRWYHYAVKEVVIEAYCPCNGHAVGCKYSNITLDNKCVCQTGTCGEKCDTCCDAYNQYPWKPGSKGPMVVDESAACQLCNCNNHSNVCVYNQTVANLNASMTIDGKYSGGGVCQNCEHNTTGVNCEQCKKFFYHPVNISRQALNTCKECGCFADGCNATSDGKVNLDCTRKASKDNMIPVGSCYCKKNVMGRICDFCKPGFYNLSKTNPEGCQVCRCDTSGSVNRSNVCEPDQDGQCPCKPNVHGIICDTCNDTYYGLTHDDPNGCKECLCDKGGSSSDICNKNDGQCPCYRNIEGRQCTRPVDRAFYPSIHWMSSQKASKLSPWTTTFPIYKGASSNSGIFALILSYQLSSSQPALVTISWQNNSITKSISLENCTQPCMRNLSEFGELSLADSVILVVNFTGDFQGNKAVALPREFYQPDILGHDQGAFLANCSLLSTDFLQETSTSDFCKKSVFTLTAGYFKQALDCNCSVVGSTNLTCEKYGGKCSCKPGVTGRQCDRCLPGYYNFTTNGCTACGCTTTDKMCDPVSGKCNCPPNTIGRVCDKCNTTFWGWNATTGCQSCNCDKTGSSSQQCNLTTGICSCKKGVHLAKCSECQDNYKNFSSNGCSLCSCDMRGSLTSVCNKTTGQCPCKANSMSMLCNQCKPGSFYLYQTNPKGCTDCICMGITHNCSSTTKYVYQEMFDLSLWDLYDEDTQKVIPVGRSEKDVNDANTIFITANISTKSSNMKWKANTNLTQTSLVSSYAGNLSFSLHVTNVSSTGAVSRPKVIIKGSKNISIEKHFDAVTKGKADSRAVFMKETSWFYSGSNKTVSRDHFMFVLAKPAAILITASLLTSNDGYYMTSFGGVQVSSVKDGPTVQGRAVDVEQCNCGPEYTGLSCERCAPSHHRVNTTDDSFFGKCQPCNCYKHTLDCHASTGYCYNCDHNTTGNHCERCLNGFYGNATDGTPADCKTCPCDAPRTTTSLCSDYYGLPKCTNCSVGYEGRLCDKCQLKYFGRPHLDGGNCTLCQCNNNTDICDTLTGQCTNCKFNTTGFHCERCVNETYGYAPVQNCTGCACNSTGSKSNVCNHRNGQCECHPNVDTRDCSKCMENSYNFTSTGCTKCNCNKFGSVKLQCNESGICTCKPHALGKTCDRCETNFFGLPHAECQMCNCSAIGSNTSVPCNGVNGQCHCKPGVTGRRCDRCMVMHHNFTSSGCTPCDECTRIRLRGILNETQKEIVDSLHKATQVKKLRPFKQELTKVENGIKTTEKLVEEFNQRIKDLRDGLTMLRNNTLNSSIQDLQAELSVLSSKADKVKENTTKALSKAEDIHNKTKNASQLVQDVHKLASLIAQDMKNLEISASRMLTDSNSTLRNSYNAEMTKVNNELATVRYARDVLASYALGNVTDHAQRLEALNTSIVANTKRLNDKLAEFDALMQRNDAVAALTQDVNSLVQQTLVIIQSSNKTLSESRLYLQHSSTFLLVTWENITTGYSHYSESEKIASNLVSNLTNLKTSIPITQALVLSTNRSVYINATLHAENLTAEAALRKRELDSVQDNAKRAVAAINQYESVVKLVNQSLETSVKVNESLQEIMKVLNAFTKSFSAMEKKAEDSVKKSQQMLNTTKDRKTDVNGLQRKVSTSKQIFFGVKVIGKQIDQYHSILLSKTTQLMEWSEPHAYEHSVFNNTRSAESWVELVNQKWPSISTNGKAIQVEAKRLNTSMAGINTQATHVRQLMHKAFQAVSTINLLMQNVTSTSTQAQLEKNKTDDLQSQLTKNMQILKAKLLLAKEKIAKIQHALRLQGNTSLQYSPKGRIAQKTAFTDVSIDIKADTVQGPLLYLAEDSNNVESQVSISIGIVNNQYVKFSYNLGSGSIPIVNYMVPIRKGSWYRIYASRLQYKARLTVTSFATNESKTYESASNLILPYKTTNFTSESPLYLGSLPDGVMVNETFRFFRGCIDNVVINQEPLKLWEPLKVTGKRLACSKCLKSATTPRRYDVTTGTSFYGNPKTHVTQRMGAFNVSSGSIMAFQFRTFLENASVVNVQGKTAYIYGVYLQSGQVMFYFSDGSRVYSLKSTRNTSYSDGRWYEVRISRGVINSTMIIKDITSGEQHMTDLALASPVVLENGQKLLFGGRNPQSNFPSPVSTQFAGGLRNISLSTRDGIMDSRMLSDNSSLEESNQVDFCGVLHTVEPCIRFLGNSHAAIATGIRNVTMLSMKFKTLNPSSVLLYGFDSTKNSYFYLALFHGNLYLVATNNPQSAEPSFTQGETLNRGEYHDLTIEITENRLKLLLGTRPTPVFNVQTPGPIYLNGTLYVGALPSSVNVPFDVPVTEHFVGGMRDILVNERRQDIFSGQASQVSLAGCPPEAFVLPTAKPTIPPPTQPPPTCGARYPALQLSTEKDRVRLGPENHYVGFNLTERQLEFMKSGHVITISFRSLSPNGILLYTTNNMAKPTQFMSIELVNSRLVFKFNSGEGLQRVQSSLNSYSSAGLWYKANFLRLGNFLAIIETNVNEYVNNGKNTGKPPPPLDLNTPMYYGGVPKGTNTSWLEAKQSNGDPIGFYGCLGNAEIMASNKSSFSVLNPRKDGAPNYSFKGNASCFKEAQPQASFKDQSYIKLYESYSLPRILDFSIKFRTYIRTGLLVVWTNSTGQGAMTLEQLQGQIVLTLTTDNNVTSFRWTDPDVTAQGRYNASYKLCDNEVHTVRVQRANSAIKISVDNHNPESFTIQDGFYLDGDLYIGGIPDGTGSPSHTGLSKRRFEGCVSEFTINLHKVDLIRDPVKKNVQPVCRGKQS